MTSSDRSVAAANQDDVRRWLRESFESGFSVSGQIISNDELDYEFNEWASDRFGGPDAD